MEHKARNKNWHKISSALYPKGMKIVLHANHKKIYYGKILYRYYTLNKNYALWKNYSTAVLCHDGKVRTGISVSAPKGFEWLKYFLSWVLKSL